MPEIVRISSSVFGSSYNNAIIEFLGTRAYAAYGDIFRAAETLGVHMSKKTLSDHLLYLENVGVVTGDIPPPDRGPGKHLMYSLNSERIRELGIIHANYVLGVSGVTNNSELANASLPADDPQPSPVDAASTRIINYLSKQVAADRAEIATGAGVDEKELEGHLRVLLELGLVRIIHDLYEVDRTKVVALFSRIAR